MSSGLGPNPGNFPQQPRPAKPTGATRIPQWVPKFEGDDIAARDPRLPMPDATPFAINPRTDNITKGSEYVGSRSRQYWIVQRGDKVMKIDPETHQIIWTRWSV